MGDDAYQVFVFNSYYRHGNNTVFYFILKRKMPPDSAHQQ